MFNALGMWFTTNNPDELNTRSLANTVLKLMPEGNAPIYALTGDVNRTTAKQVTHGYFTKTYQLPSVQLNGAIANGVATTFTFDSTEGLVPGMVFQVSTTRENVRIGSITSATVAEVVRGFGEVTAAAIADDVVLFYIGSAYEQGSDRPNALSVPAVFVSNYTQIFRNAWLISRTARQSLAEADWDNIAENKMDCLGFHSQGIELAILFGQAVAPAGSPPRSATRGVEQAVIAFAPANYTASAGATTTYEQLRTMIDPAYEFKSSENASSVRAAFTDRLGAEVLTDIGRIETNYSSTQRTIDVFGMVFKEMEFNGGRMQWRRHPLLSQFGGPKGRLIGIDMPSLKIAYLGGTDAMAETFYGSKDGSNDGKDAIGGGLTTEMAVEFKNPRGSFVIHGLTAAA